MTRLITQIWFMMMGQAAPGFTSLCVIVPNKIKLHFLCSSAFEKK